MKELLQKQRKFIAVYAIWFFINLVILLMSDGDPSDFWPFCDCDLFYNYDFSEFVVFVFGPLIGLFAYIMFTKKD